MEMVTIEDIYEAYFDCRKHKRKTFNALAFEMDYESNLHNLCKEINDRTYTIGKSICFVVHRPKDREVFAADFRDRIIHHYVVRKIEPLFESVFIDDTYNCRFGKGVLYGVGRLQEKIKSLSCNYTKDIYIGKFDCKGFFMSIHKPTLWKMLECFIKDNYKDDDIDDILWLTEKIVLNCPHKNCIRKSPLSEWKNIPKDKSLFTCGDEYGLPIGNLSSQIFANFYLQGFDIIMSDLFGGYYGRYVDDWYVLSEVKEKIPKSMQVAKDVLLPLNVKLHPNKVYIQHYSKGVKFIGGVIKFNRRYIAKSTMYNFRECISELNEIEDKESSIMQASQRINSYLGFCRQYLTYGLRISILKELSPEWRKYIYITGRSEKMVIRNKYKKFILC